MNKLKALSLTLITVFLISACSTPKKVEMSDDQKSVNESLIAIVSEAIREKNYKQVERGLYGLMINGNQKTWSFIQPALFNLPKEQALNLLSKASKNKGIQSSSENLFNISKTYITFKEKDKALEFVTAAHELDPKNPEILYWRARLQTVLKNYSIAESDFKKAIKLNPNKQEYKEQYASLLQETKQFAAAQKVLQKLDPSINNLYKRIIFALQNDNKTQAETVFQKLLEMPVEDEELNSKNFFVGESAYWLKKPELSEEYYRKVSGGDNYLDARQMLTHMLYEQKRYDEAIELLHQLQNAELNYSNQAYLLESQIHKEQDDYDSAFETLNRSLELTPKNTDILYNRAMLFESQDDMENAMKDLKKAIEIKPEFTEAYNALGYSMAEHDIELESALGYIQIALDRNPESAAILDSMGWVQYKLGNIEKAEEYLLKAMSKDLNDVEIYIHLHTVQMKLNKPQEANKVLEKAKKLFPDNQRFKEYLLEFGKI